MRSFPAALCLLESVAQKRSVLAHIPSHLARVFGNCTHVINDVQVHVASQNFPRPFKMQPHSSLYSVRGVVPNVSLVLAMPCPVCGLFVARESRGAT